MRRARSSFRTRPVLLLPLCLSCGFFFVVATQGYRVDLNVIVLIALLTAVYGLGFAALIGKNAISFPVVYGAYLCLSHLGLVGVDAVAPGTVETLRVTNGLGIWVYDQWFYHPALYDGVLVAGLGIASYFLTVGVVLFWAQRHERFVTLPLAKRGDQRFYRLSLVLLVLSIGYLVVSIFTGTLDVSSDYATYFESTGSAPLYSTFLLVLALGIILAVATGDRRQVILAAVLFAVPSVILMASGSRAGILYALAAVTAVLGNRGFRLRLSGLLVALAIFFILIPSVRQLRAVTAGERDLSTINLNLAEPFVELGFQMRPLVYTVRWIEDGEDYAYGGTYWLPIQRIIALVVPMDRIPLENNPHYIGARLPGFGYSVIAEAFFNFGLVGVILIPGGIGVLLCHFNNAPHSSRLALYGAIMQILINHQRNAFIFVPGQILVVCALYIFVAHPFIRRRL